MIYLGRTKYPGHFTNTNNYNRGLNRTVYCLFGHKLFNLHMIELKE